MSSYNGCYLKKRSKVRDRNVQTYGKLTCEYCGKAPLQRTQDNAPDFCTIDHFIPLDKGGDNKWDNLYVACLECNRSKGNQTPHDFSTHYFNVKLETLSSRFQGQCNFAIRRALQGTGN